MPTSTVDFPIWRNFESLKTAAQRNLGFFYYHSYGRPVIIRGRAPDLLRKGDSLFLIGSKFLFPASLGFRFYGRSLSEDK